MKLRLQPLTLLCQIVMFWLGMHSGIAQAMDTPCPTQQSLSHAFKSGATWTLCADVSETHGLTVSTLRYRAPGDFDRNVLQRMHLGQLLLHYHDQRDALAQISPLSGAAQGISQTRTLPMNTHACDGDIINTVNGGVCSRIKNNRTLAKYAQRPSLHSQSWELTSAFRRGALTWSTTVTLTEDGTVRPSVSLSGRLHRRNDNIAFAAPIPALTNAQPLVRATLLSTWKLVFDLDTDAPDRVEQFDFILDPTRNNRRTMQVSAIETETLKQVERDQFRGWRIIDASGSGYYLDPAKSGFSYISQNMNWAQFDVGFTRFKPCEVYALSNRLLTNNNDCADSLDDFVSGESLQGAQPVMWYNQSRTISPSQEHWPVIADILLTFDLLPFDWTGSSPFEVIE